MVSLSGLWHNQAILQWIRARVVGLVTSIGLEVPLRFKTNPPALQPSFASVLLGGNRFAFDQFVGDVVMSYPYLPYRIC